ncbi:hypothetical protein BDQ17DRAFT_1535786 [Cyathus striatus]|nr:hypothetical protein BDQ17DRAFT_1535786 [Cyathus striatus]
MIVSSWLKETLVDLGLKKKANKLLTDAVRRYGEQDNWKTIALSVPGRTNKACRKRWLHSLSPNVKKTAWTTDEDKLLIELYNVHGPKWSAIARQIPGRTDDACSKRYREALDPALRKDEWTAEEDEKLLEVYAQLGGKWGQVGQVFGRSGLGCRNRWRLLERKKKAAEAQMHKSRPTASLTDVSEPASHTSYASHQVPQLDPILEDAGSLGYYPEAYSNISSEAIFGNKNLLIDPAPDDIRPLHAQVAPFQVSSTSSLSKALSDSPRVNYSLPPTTPAQQAEPQPNSGNLSLSSLASSPLYPPSNDMSQDTIMALEDGDGSNFGELFGSVDYASQNYYGSGVFGSVSPLSFPSEMLPSNGHNTLQVIGFLKSPNPLASIDISMFDPTGEGYDQSSATTTPFHVSSPISASCSPHPFLSHDLPAYEQQPTAGSLLFSAHPGLNSRPSPIFSHNSSYTQSSSRFQTPATSCNSTPSTQPVETLVSRNTSPIRHNPVPLPSSVPKYYSARRLKKITSKKPSKPPQMKPGSRLSSALALCDPTLRPYACGRESCWPESAATGIACYATSKELLDHTKEEHPDDLPGDRPFRCALTGCGKSWKSINGLQYHLQVSTAHFRYALSSATQSIPLDDSIQTGSGTETEADDSQGNFYCPHTHCTKTYRQPSGLRYHLKHGHPEKMPAQLSTVPPALARHMSTKVRKRRKPPSEAEE